MYQRLRRRLPSLLVDLGYVLFRAGIILLIVLCSDATLAKFQYVSF